MTLTLRQYIPQVGKSIKMREFSDYTSRSIHPWSWLRVHSINSDGATVQVLNGSEPTGQTLTIPLPVIAAPIGWRSRYTIYCNPDMVATILNVWFARGIVVRANHCIGDPMGMTFQPMDNAGIPHWKYPELTDAINAEDCTKLFRVIAEECQEINHYANPEHPNLREMGRTRRAHAIKAMRADGWMVEYKPHAGGFWRRTREIIVHDWAE